MRPRKPRPSGNSELLTRREAAVYLGVTEQTLAVWHCAGRYDLPVVKVGRLVKYRRSDLERFLVRGAEKGTKKRQEPSSLPIGFAEVSVVDGLETKQASHAISAPLEITMPSGIKMRVDIGCPMHLLVSVVQALENR